MIKCFPLKSSVLKKKCTHTDFAMIWGCKCTEKQHSARERIPALDAKIYLYFIIPPDATSSTGGSDNFTSISTRLANPNRLQITGIDNTDLKSQSM